MSLATNVANLATRIGTEFKAVYAKIGTLSSLNTTAKTDLVSAINEVKASAGVQINDTSASTTSTYSSSKVNSLDAATLSSANSYTDSSVASKPSVNDTTASASNTYSSNKINSLDAATLASAQSYADTKITNLVAGAPAALDTLKELADAINDDASFAATTTTALGNRLRFDAAQTLTGAQQSQGQANLSVPSTTQVGDTTTDFVATFNTALT